METQIQDMLKQRFAQEFGEVGERKLLYVRTPGRTEICGNHTDHEGGTVVAGAVDRHVHALFSANGTSKVCVVSAGHGTIEVDLSQLEPVPEERNTSRALVRGVAACVAQRGYEVGGFDCVMTSEVPKGSGLSSSAAFEVELAQAMNQLFAGGEIPREELAKIGQKAEREFFGKPCGLMDQASAALGSIQHMDFSVPSGLDAQAIHFDFAEHGYAVCLVAVGSSHEDLTDEYAAVPAEMQAVARKLGKEVLGQVDEQAVLDHIPELRAELGDRAVLRALHFFREDRLVAERAAALRAGDIEAFLELERLSGASSAMYLQNVAHGTLEQPAMVALALAEELLHDCSGAARIHGGGFGGTIQVFVPLERVEQFSAGMDAAFGEGACGVYAIDHEGTVAQWL